MMMIVQTAWHTWADLFSGLPYGDPYVACATLFVLIVMAAKTVAGGETS